MRRPISVVVDWSESGDFYDGCDYPFAQFEARARKVAEAHKTGGYLKTAVTVTFDDGHTYGCRLDLGAGYRLDKGFQDHIERCAGFHASAEGKARLDDMAEALRADWMALAEVWKTMDFSPEPPPAEPAEECLPHGIQLLIPGVAPISRPAKRGGDDRQAALF